VLVAPNNSSYMTTQIPDEDSLDLEFTDANLFSINRFPGVDRLEGGVRANLALDPKGQELHMRRSLSGERVTTGR